MAPKRPITQLLHYVIWDGRGPSPSKHQTLCGAYATEAESVPRIEGVTCVPCLREYLRYCRLDAEVMSADPVWVAKNKL
jgi:hypothetical protein